MDFSLVRAEKARALIGAAVLGSVMGLAIGGAYMAGSLARASVSAPQAERLAVVASQRYSESALTASTRDPSALALSQNYQAPAPAPEKAAAPAPQKSAGTQLASVKPKDVPKPFRLGVADKGRDLDCLTQAVYYEARGEDKAGQAAVAQVILNRVRHPAFPKSVCAVVFQGVRGVGCQFSFACDGSVRRAVENAAWRRAREIAEGALEGAVMAQVGTATHFHAARLNDPFGAGLKRVAQIGTHIFYKFAGRRGAGGAFSGEPEPSLAEHVGPETPNMQPVYASFALPALLPSASSAAEAPAITAHDPVSTEAMATRPVGHAAPAAASSATPAALKPLLAAPSASPAAAEAKAGPSTPPAV